MGDVVFKGFQCLNSECLEFIFVRKGEIGLVIVVLSVGKTYEELMKENVHLIIHFPLFFMAPDN